MTGGDASGTTLRGAYDPGERHDLLRAREAPDQPPLILGGLAYQILNRGTEGEEARALVREAQQRHPEDFWINLHLGYILLAERPQEAVGYFRAAVASRPESSQAHIMVGRALHDAGDADGAIAAFRKAIPLTSNLAGARDLARALAPRGGLEEARALWAKAVGSVSPGLRPLGRLRPALRIPRQRGSVPLGPQGPPRTPQRQHRPLGHGRARQPGLSAPAGFRGGAPTRGRARGPGRGHGTEVLS